MPAESSRFRPKPAVLPTGVGVPEADAEVDGDVAARQDEAAVDPGGGGRARDAGHERRREQRHERGGSPRVQSVHVRVIHPP